MVSREGSSPISPYEGNYDPWRLHWIAGRAYSGIGSPQAPHRFAQAIAALPTINTRSPP